MTEWFNRKPGEGIMAKQVDDESILITSGGSPDWIRLPPQLGGEQRRVLKVGPRMCVAKDCKEIHPCFYLEGGIFVIECTTTNQFYWAQEKQDTKKE